jgi:tRNA1(Val) A37 N6-methylase TrmN6
MEGSPSIEIMEELLEKLLHAIQSNNVQNIIKIFNDNVEGYRK